jgi:hypothetical protein
VNPSSSMDFHTNEFKMSNATPKINAIFLDANGTASPSLTWHTVGAMGMILGILFVLVSSYLHVQVSVRTHSKAAVGSIPNQLPQGCQYTRSSRRLPFGRALAISRRSSERKRCRCLLEVESTACVGHLPDQAGLPEDCHCQFLVRHGGPFRRQKQLHLRPSAPSRIQ